MTRGDAHFGIASFFALFANFCSCSSFHSSNSRFASSVSKKATILGASHLAISLIKSSGISHSPRLSFSILRKDSNRYGSYQNIQTRKTFRCSLPPLLYQSCKATVCILLYNLQVFSKISSIYNPLNKHYFLVFHKSTRRTYFAFLNKSRYFEFSFSVNG